MELTVKQLKFADEYIISGNAEEAATRAGYKSPRGNAHKLLQNTAIKSYIDERLNELQSPKIANQEEILEFLTSVFRGEVTEPVAVLDGAGRQRIEQLLPSVQTRKGAAEQLGKRYAMWTDKQQVENITPTFVEDVPEDDS